jgi:hypothetical protein
MENTEYKCMCCGWLGNEEEFGVYASKEFIASTEFEVCPQCGSMDVNVLVAEVDILA